MSLSLKSSNNSDQEKSLRLVCAQSLDTLAQLSQNPEKNLLKKAQRKALTVLLAGNLIALKSTNIAAYRNMFYCNSVLQQDGQELKTSYCKSRFCAVCNSIKTANLINGYVPELQKFKDPQFATFTIKAVKGKFVKSAIDKMLKDFRHILQQLTKFHKIKISGIRKLECNYNEEKGTYNPHFHLIVDGEENARMLLNMWLKLNGRSKEIAQDIRPADVNSMRELFKYATKTVSKTGKINAKELDIIYSALRRKRIIQPFGSIRKVVDEDAREKVEYKELIPEKALWNYSPIHYDWFNVETGEALTNYAHDAETKEIFEREQHKMIASTEINT